MESKIRIPHVAKGTKAEECIMRAIKAKGSLQNWSLEEDIFQFETQDKRDIIWGPSTDLFFFDISGRYGDQTINQAYTIAVLALNVDLLQFRIRFQNVERGFSDFHGQPFGFAMYLEVMCRCLNLVCEILKNEHEHDKRIKEYLHYFNKLLAVRYGKDTIAPLEDKPKNPGRGLKKKSFDKENEKRNKDLFVNFLSKHGYPRWFENDKESETNLAFICFCKCLGIREIESAPACYRFLTEVCGLTPPPSQSKDRPGHQWCRNFKIAFRDTQKLKGYIPMRQKMSEYLEENE